MAIMLRTFHKIFGSYSNNTFISRSSFLRSLSQQSNEKDQKVEDPGVSEDSTEFKSKLDALQLKYTEIEDKYKRSLAEIENTRRRYERQIADARIFSTQSFCKDLLEVVDILNKATESLDATTVQKSSSDLQNLYQGLVMTEKKLQSVFSKHGLQKISPSPGDKFDPNLHEAVFATPVTTIEQNGSISLLTKTGYSLHGRPLRPAFVGVYSKS